MWFYCNVINVLQLKALKAAVIHVQENIAAMEVGEFYH
jgi:hypothetical protein